MSQYPKNRVGDAGTCSYIQLLSFQKFVMNVDDIAQCREQMMADSEHHLAIDEGATWCIE